MVEREWEKLSRIERIKVLRKKEKLDKGGKKEREGEKTTETEREEWTVWRKRENEEDDSKLTPQTTQSPHMDTQDEKTVFLVDGNPHNSDDDATTTETATENNDDRNVKACRTEKESQKTNLSSPMEGGKGPSGHVTRYQDIKLICKEARKEASEDPVVAETKCGKLCPVWRCVLSLIHI